jgi:hypothetical protein
MRAVLILCSVLCLALAGCDQPKWRGDGAAPGAAPQAVTAAASTVAPTRPVDPGPTPAPPPWAQGLVGKPLREAFPGTGVCKGNTDIIEKTYAGSPAGVRIHGWGWDVAAKTRVARILLVDADARIVGAGEGGASRPDVTAAVPEVTDGQTGWNADLARTSGVVDTFGVVGGGKAVCVLGRMAF